MTVLVVWALMQSNGVASAVAAPVVPAAAHEMAGMKGMAGMAGHVSRRGLDCRRRRRVGGGRHRRICDASGPRGLRRRRCRPWAPGNVHHYTIRLADEMLDIAPGVRYSGWTFDGVVARSGDSRAGRATGSTSRS